MKHREKTHNCRRCCIKCMIHCTSCVYVNVPLHFDTQPRKTKSINTNQGYANKMSAEKCICGRNSCEEADANEFCQRQKGWPIDRGWGGNDENEGTSETNDTL